MSEVEVEREILIEIEFESKADIGGEVEVEIEFESKLEADD